MSFRIGIGYDVHRFKAGRKCILGGVEIPHTVGLEGHSDADCLLHAIADAVLGALALPDIGHFFPDNDPACKDMDSMTILQRACEEATKMGYQIVNIDSTIIAEAPKIGPHLDAMKASIAEGIGLQVNQVGIKATTHEKIGSLGREEGLAAQAVVLLGQ